mmetsp:Transcript_32433/g.95750  ORF Transcript_32433/g.95750 Transcript_32433/m.95750 type:complete len:122 (-) Transcript_32433:1712-2077(-)
MLQDLYPSEGLSRAEALAAATRAYEEEMRAGAVRNLLSGKMVRLLLLQVQALKLQSLRAMDTLDRLVDSNKLNLQLFATLPACLLAVAASRLARAGATALRGARQRKTETVPRTSAADFVW